MVNAFNPDSLAHLDPALAHAIERRTRLLGPAYRLFYQTPVEVCRGSGTRLFDKQGGEYLDAYNNVVSVGHCNPHVIEAVHEQMSTLCTHTRYVQDGILDYAEAMLPSFGGRIGETGHMMFTCTGSEANDLALRIAKHHTGRRGIIVTEEAYHGNSELTAGFSPSLGERAPLGTWVRRIPAPDSYRHDPAALGRMLADAVTRQAYELMRAGDGLAAFVADSLFSSDGVYASPEVLGPVAEAVRAAGGLFIADEVQAGFGRSGDRFWGYQRHGIDPDIVTMGKPMGNGFPVAAIAVTPEAVASFGSDMRYFNTFGGNGVAIAAARATREVILNDNLQANATRIGALLRDGISGLANRFEGIGDVRGAGLYIGVEMVTERAARSPDAALAARIVNEMRERRVLISATGPEANVLKIRPPLVFSDADADWLLSTLEAVLAA
ncbi:aspartate aminotransferase family protein [Pseudooceanicola sp. CBS1P-1]|uniref:Aminotransferase class III-fold pyridoxal phosphate-dependent enzyme n=2 Tax=Paracoccaceae TaxID=31989 RepID=A0A6L7FZY3_9RHOB|nr:aspartate aminotransferase family protein [Pseudooceanicola endophyticus]MXN17365.1 aminotransferase class III-fold pyridoxal phosphate-dependent enzyme [Pseudooceanicola albus]